QGQTSQAQSADAEKIAARRMAWRARTENGQHVRAPCMAGRCRRASKQSVSGQRGRQGVPEIITLLTDFSKVFGERTYSPAAVAQKLHETRLLEELRDFRVSPAGHDDELHLSTQRLVAIEHDLAVLFQRDHSVLVAVDVENRHLRLSQRLE